MANRGEIASIGRATQLIAFEGMRWGKITPTDIDFAIEARGAYVFGEFKYKDKPLDLGQRLALQNLSKAVYPAPSLLFVATHETPLPHAVIARECRVVEVHYNGKQLSPQKVAEFANVKELVDRFLKYHVELDAHDAASGL